MKVIPIALKAHMESGSTSLATCWKATLTDGTVVAATSHHRDIVFGGVTYVATNAYNPTDIESTQDLNPDNLEVEGFLASPSITDEDIHSGRWDFAAVEIFEVNYRDLTMGRHVTRSGTLGEVRGGRSKFTAELRGMMQAFTRRIGRLTTKECLADLGDSRCRVSMASFTVDGVIDSVSNNRIIYDATRTEVADWFTGGKLTINSGPNAGLSMEVKRSAVGELELQQPFYEPLEAGVTYVVHAGCQKRFSEDCVAKFANGVNFYGFPHVPGNKIYRSGMVDYADADVGVIGGGAPTEPGTITEPVRIITAVQNGVGDVWYTDPAGGYTLSEVDGEYPCYTTLRRIFTVPNHGYEVGDYIILTGGLYASETFEAAGLGGTVTFIYNGVPEDPDTVPAYVHYQRVCAVTTNTFELWGSWWSEDQAGRDFDLATPVEFTDVPYNGNGRAQRAFSTAVYINPIPRSVDGVEAATSSPP